MPKPATGKWPRIKINIHCRTCDTKINFSVYYGQSTVWSNQAGSKLAEWARHEDHDLDFEYAFYDGHKRAATK